MAQQRNLKIADNLELPAVEAVTQTLVVYGGKGMGKTNLAAVLAEELAKCGKRFSILDPVGVSWGLRHSADGKGQGLNVLILGGLHGDLPIEPTGGVVVADFVADEEQDTVIDISRRSDGRMWSNGEKIRFVTEYATRLYMRQGERRRPIMQLIDEAGRFVPQNLPKGADQIAACVGAIEQLVELGRNVGVGVTLITQRSARMAKSVSELAECMVAFRTVGPNSVGAILDWFGDHVEKSRWKDLVEQLRSLPRGQALIVSPGWLEFEGVAAIRKRETFDSSSTPTGTERALAKRGARPDLEKYRTRIAETVEKAEASDPSKMRAKLVALEKRTVEAEAKVADVLKRLEAEQAKPKGEKRVDVAVLTDHDRALLAKLADRIDALDEDALDATAESIKGVHAGLEALVSQHVERLADRIGKSREKFLNEINATSIVRVAAKLEAVAAVPRQAPASSAPTLDARRPSPPAPPRASTPPPAPRVASGPIAEDHRLVNSKGELKKHVRGILTVLAQHGAYDRAAILILAGYSPSGDISTAFGGLLDHGLIDVGVGVTLKITEKGLLLLGEFEPLPTGAELRDYLLARASSAERKILGALFAAYPNAESRVQLHERAGLKPSGDTSTAFGKFLRLGWALERDGGIVAAETFFQ